MSSPQKSHPYYKAEIVFATMHGKEQLLKSLFAESLAAQLVLPEGIDTDTLGSFTGEVPRAGDLQEVLRNKAKLGLAKSRAVYAIASEGSFSAHPQMPWLDCNQESLLFLDTQNSLEIFVHHLSTENALYYQEFRELSELQNFLRQIDFGPQALVMRPDLNSKDSQFLFKGLTTRDQLQEAYQRLRQNFPQQTLVVETDLRAHLNPKRQQVIRQAGELLMEKILCLCPACQSPGFCQSSEVAGLACEACGVPSEYGLYELWSCPNLACLYEEKRQRRDAKTSLPVELCPVCNP